ncbi:Rne/Rng family ribonuclease [Rickettsia endosymbiont of Cardiosporidium cionae]|uniref:Rne/Rng family ribonuclease n=1 Tax=Rickettsia endosymbiont of Cardiosporidium cionae TaxID=2777155 RepID=UPI001894AAC4|nr:Rne/Rng family ribonuclease [Rickettsia endosymbiont of Cardiosporidium cionae]KAF8818743.1 ribonuclease E/G [Rickettsia endosymbiont of Cardiosporidium cionae]
MSKKIIIDAAFPTEIRVVMLDKNNNIEVFESEQVDNRSIVGNIYLATIGRVEPSLQAVFVNYGNEKSGFLPFSEIHPDYYNILVNNQEQIAYLRNKKLSANNIDFKKLDNNLSNNNNLPDIENIDVNEIDSMVQNNIAPSIDIEASGFDHDIIMENKNITTDYQKNHSIQDVIKKGSLIVVQVIKEERGNKGAFLSTYISLAGKYCVFMPNKESNNCISKKISNIDERKRIKDIIDSLNSNEDKECSSIIARTAAFTQSSADIARDYMYLVKLWNNIRSVTLKSDAPCFIYQNDNILLKTIRDLVNYNVSGVIIQGDQVYNDFISYMNDILPDKINCITKYDSNAPIFIEFSIEEQLSKLYQSVVTLPSGGYIVINPTEALVAIDINSGKDTSERNVEEMALKNNLEASKEIAKQVKLRQLSGLIVIDFIDMYDLQHKKIIERSLRELFREDKAKIQIKNISEFGLLEMSRQRFKSSFLENNSKICHQCSGKGIVRADDANAMLIFRTIEHELYLDSIEILNIFTNSSTIIYILNSKRTEISFIENKYSVKLNFYIDSMSMSDVFSIEKISRITKLGSQFNKAVPALQNVSDMYYENGVQSNQNDKKVSKKQTTQLKDKNKKRANNKSNNESDSESNNIKKNTRRRVL